MLSPECWVCGLGPWRTEEVEMLTGAHRTAPLSCSTLPARLVQKRDHIKLRPRDLLPLASKVPVPALSLEGDPTAVP